MVLLRFLAFLAFPYVVVLFETFKYHVITVHHDVDIVNAYRGASLSKYSFLSPFFHSSGKELKLFLLWSVRLHILGFLFTVVCYFSLYDHYYIHARSRNLRP